MTIAQYGHVVGELLSFGTIMERLGHSPTTLIYAVKLDCEGYAP